MTPWPEKSARLYSQAEDAPVHGVLSFIQGLGSKDLGYRA